MQIGYKLFRVDSDKKGRLFPLFVRPNDSITIGEWVEAKNGEETKNGKVKSKIGPLCFRAGWHLSEIPLAVHIGIKKDGVIKYMHPNHVWCECYYNDDINYQNQANKNGTRNGKIIPVKAMMKEAPKGGFYRYKTSPHMLGEWIIAGEICVIRVLSDEEVKEICMKKGYEAQKRMEPLNLSDYGF